MVLAGVLALQAGRPDLPPGPEHRLRRAPSSAPTRNSAPRPTCANGGALASAAFEKPPSLLPATSFRNERPVRDEAPFRTRLQVKDEWLSDEGLRLNGALVAYKARF